MNDRGDSKWLVIGLVACVIAGIMCVATWSGECAATEAAEVEIGESAAPALPPRFVGYGLSETWQLLNLQQLATLLKQNGLNMTELEYLGGAGGSGSWNNINHPKTKEFVEAMRAQGIWTFLNIVNWNVEDARTRSDAEFQAEFDWIKESIGTDHVILQAVSEWGDDDPPPTK